MSQTPAMALLEDLNRAGIELEAEADRLRYRPRSKIGDDLLARMHTHKADLLKLIRERNSGRVPVAPVPRAGWVTELILRNDRFHWRQRREDVADRASRSRRPGKPIDGWPTAPDSERPLARPPVRTAVPTKTVYESNSRCCLKCGGTQFWRSPIQTVGCVTCHRHIPRGSVRLLVAPATNPEHSLLARPP